MNANPIGHELMRGWHMNFTQFQCLVALAETGSFTEAAYTIGMTQSAVSHALAALEKELGVTLLERNRKGVVALSRVGQEILSHARIVLAHAESIEQEARRARNQGRGKLRLGSISSVPPDLLTGMLTYFKQQYPDIEVVQFEGTMQEIHEWIYANIIDVGFVLRTAGKKSRASLCPGAAGLTFVHGKEIESKPVMTSELQIFVPVGHRLHAQAKVMAEDLQTEPLILPKMACEFMEVVGLEPSKRSEARIRYHAGDSRTLLSMVREGLGITVLPRTMLPEKLDGLVALSLDPPRYLQIGLGVKSWETVSARTALFVETAQTWISRSSFLSKKYA